MNSSTEIPAMAFGRSNARKLSHAVCGSSFEANRTDGSEVPDLP